MQQDESRNPSLDRYTRTFNASPNAPSVRFVYPITTELPHVHLTVGRKQEASVEGLLDTGGACTMGDLTYWKEVAARLPNLIAHFEELATYQEKPIAIGGVGAGKVVITHVMGLWLPWMIGKDDTKLVIGLGDNMPMTLLIGLPFIIATQAVIDVGNATCHSKVLNSTWKLHLKRPQRKDVRTLDAVMSSGRRHTFQSLPPETLLGGPR